MGALVVIFLALYFLPTLVAVGRGKRNKGSIFVLNFFLGWSLIGWVIALVWAIAQDGVMVVQTAPSQNSTGTELQKLTDLKNQGAISNDEFEAGKKKILSTGA